MKNTKLFVCLFLLVVGCLWLATPLSAQVSISDDGSLADSSAMLDVKSVTKGLLVPRMAMGQIEEISNPANGMLVFCTTNDKFYAYLSNGNAWKEVAFGSGTITPWSCGLPFMDFRDGRSYSTVLIGTQCWMAQNLNSGVKIPGTTEQTDNGIIEKYCYNNDENNCAVYGGLYQWNEMMQYGTADGAHGICLTGWHVPTDAEFSTLVGFLGGPLVAGGKLKETGLSHWFSPNAGASNSSGFTGLGAGRRNTNGTFEYLIWYLQMRSSTNFDATFAWSLSLSCWYTSSDRSNLYEKSYGFSVRCIKD
jgi:uncharacterized protein (TIGR02145 family)